MTAQLRSGSHQGRTHESRRAASNNGPAAAAAAAQAPSHNIAANTTTATNTITSSPTSRLATSELSMALEGRQTPSTTQTRRRARRCHCGTSETCANLIVRGRRRESRSSANQYNRHQASALAAAVATSALWPTHTKRANCWWRRPRQQHRLRQQANSKMFGLVTIVALVLLLVGGCCRSAVPLAHAIGADQSGGSKSWASSFASSAPASASASSGATDAPWPASRLAHDQRQLASLGQAWSDEGARPGDPSEQRQAPLQEAGPARAALDQQLLELQLPGAATTTTTTTNNANNTIKNVTAQNGQSVLLHCLVEPSGEVSVSWFRGTSELQLLTSESLTIIPDERFVVRRGLVRPDDWALQIKNLDKATDSGLYQCQTDSEPPRSQFYQLNVVEPQVHILGAPDLAVRSGSPINLTCVISQSPDQLQFIFWYRDDRMINYELQERGKIVISKWPHKQDTITSNLHIFHSRHADSGNYSCQPSGARPQHIQVHVLEAAHSQHQANSALSVHVVRLTRGRVYALFLGYIIFSTWFKLVAQVQTCISLLLLAIIGLFLGKVSQRRGRADGKVAGAPAKAALVAYESCAKRRRNSRGPAALETSLLGEAARLAEMGDDLDSSRSSPSERSQQDAGQDDTEELVDGDEDDHDHHHGDQEHDADDERHTTTSTLAQATIATPTARPATSGAPTNGLDPLIERAHSALDLLRSLTSDSSVGSLDSIADSARLAGARRRSAATGARRKAPQGRPHKQLAARQPRHLALLAGQAPVAAGRHADRAQAEPPPLPLGAPPSQLLASPSSSSSSSSTSTGYNSDSRSTSARPKTPALAPSEPPADSRALAHMIELTRQPTAQQLLMDRLASARPLSSSPLPASPLYASPRPGGATCDRDRQLASPHH